MPTIQFTDVANIYKTVYEPAIYNQVVQKFRLLEILRKAGRLPPPGTNTTFGVRVGANQEVYALPFNGDLGTGGMTVTMPATITDRAFYGVMRIDQRAMYRAATSDQALVELFTNEAQSVAETFAERYNRHAYLDGSGVIAQVASVAYDGGTGLTTVTCVQAPDGVLGADTVGADGSRYVRAGMRVRIGSAAELVTPVAANMVLSAQVTSVPTRNTFTLTGDYSGGVLIAASDLVVVTSMNVTAIGGGTAPTAVAQPGSVSVLPDDEYGADNAGAYFEARQKAFPGLEAIIDDGTNTLPVGGTGFQGVNSGTYPSWQSQVLDGGTPAALQTLSMDLLLQLFDAVDENAPAEMGGISWMLCHHSVARAYYATMFNDARFSPMEFAGGFRTLTFSAGGKPIPLWLDRDCRYNTLYAGSAGCFRIVETRPFGFERKGGGIVKLVASKDAIEAQIKHYWNLGAVNRSGLGKIPNLQVTGLRRQN